MVLKSKACHLGSAESAPTDWVARMEGRTWRDCHELEALACSRSYEESLFR